MEAMRSSIRRLKQKLKRGGKAYHPIIVPYPNIYGVLS
jgi:hypothetical protein